MRQYVTICDRCGAEHRSGIQGDRTARELDARGWALVFPSAVIPASDYHYPANYVRVGEVCGSCLTDDERDLIASVRGKGREDDLPF
jgi:hypothetical protein